MDYSPKANKNRETMKLSKRITFTTILGFLLILSCSGNPKSFNINKFENQPTKVVKNFIESVGMENIKTSAFQKVAVIEFNVEFLIDLPSQECVRLTDKMYQIFTDSIKSIVGWEIISKDAITNSPIYKLLRKKQWDQRFREPKEENDPIEVISTIYPASQLAILQPSQEGVMSRYTNKLIEAAILEDVEASAVLKVHTVVDYFYKRGEGKIVIAPVDDQTSVGSKVEILIDYTKTSSPGMGYKARDKKEYIYAYKNNFSFMLKEPLVAYESISAKKSTFAFEEFSNQLEAIYKIYVEMLAIEIEQNL
jgi:hypothetical protein